MAEETDQTIFDLIIIYFGEEETTARPFEFLTDDNDDLIKPIKASTSCPYCGHGQEVDLTYWTEGPIGVQCTECGAGDNYFVEQPENIDANSDTVNVDRSKIQSELEAELSDDEEEPDKKSITVKNSGSITIDESEDVETLKSNCPFVDPIDLGLIEIEEI